MPEIPKERGSRCAYVIPHPGHRPCAGIHRRASRDEYCDFGLYIILVETKKRSLVGLVVRCTHLFEAPRPPFYHTLDAPVLPSVHHMLSTTGAAERTRKIGASRIVAGITRVGSATGGVAQGLPEEDGGTGVAERRREAADLPCTRS